MNVFAIGSVRGSPGVTTTSLLLTAALGDAVLVEADLNGGVLAIRYGLGREPGLATLAAERPGAGEGWRAHAQSAGGVAVLVGPDGPESSRGLWAAAADRLAAHVDHIDATAVVDLGRLGPATPLLGVIDRLIVAVRPVADDLVGLNHRLAGLRSTTRGTVHVVLVGSGPYRPVDLAPWGLDVCGTLPDDERTARALAEGGSSSAVRRGVLARSVMSLAEHLAASTPIGAVR